MKVHGEEVHCSSQNIYPKPHVSWATDPPTSSEALQATTESLPDSVGLFTLESEVAILGNLSGYTYICSISLEGASQLWTASLKHQDIIEGAEGQALSIPCHAPNDLQNFTLTWAFMTTEQPSVFLSFSSWTGKVANNWIDRVQLDPVQAQTGDGSLQLQNSQGQENGTFICTFSNEYSRHTVYTSIRVTGAGNPVPEWLWAVVVFAVIAFIIILAFIIWRLYIHFCSRHAEEGKKQQSECQQEHQTKNDYQLVRQDNKGNEQSDHQEKQQRKDNEQEFLKMDNKGNEQSDHQEKQQRKDNEQEFLEMDNKGNEQSDPEG